MARPETFDDLTPADKVGDLILKLPSSSQNSVLLNLPDDLLTLHFQFRVALDKAVKRGDVVRDGNEFYIPLTDAEKRDALAHAQADWDEDQKRLAAVLGDDEDMELRSWMKFYIRRHASNEGYDMDVVEEALDAYQWAE